MYLVFDVGGTFVKYAWMSVNGDIQEKENTQPRPRKKNLYQNSWNLSDRFMTNTKIRV